MSAAGPTGSQIFINLQDKSGLEPSVATAYVAGWINGGSTDATKPFLVLDHTGNYVAPSTPQSFTVSATSGWQNTGISVTSTGATVQTVCAVSGTWTADPETNGGQPYGAAGWTAGPPVPMDRTGFVMPGLPMGGLVGRIGETGQPFFIGAGTFIVPPGSQGTLYLVINDDLTGEYGAGLTDNSGSIVVQVATGLSFHPMASIPTITLETPTNGNERLIVVVAPSQPLQLPIAANMVLEFTAYPYAGGAPPAALFAPGPFDVFEFGYDAQADVTAVNGFGLNLSFTYGTEQYGVDPSIARGDIEQAFKDFIATETAGAASAAAFKSLLYKAALNTNAPKPNMVGGQFFAICDPNDYLVALTSNYNQASGDALETYWDDALKSFFAPGSYLSIDLGGNTYSGQCSTQTNPLTNVACPAYTLSNGTNSYTFYKPMAAGASKPGLTGAQYMFQQAFNTLTPAGNVGDAANLQDVIWEALCRGVGPDGVFATSVTNGESTTAWNDATKWYATGKTCHLYAKFLHQGTVKGTQLMVGGAAYGYGMDENPLGTYTGPNVPSKTLEDVPGGSTMTLTLGPWAAAKTA